MNKTREPPGLSEWLSALSRIKKNWPTRGWSFDNRFGTLASTFRSDVAPVARSAIAQVLATEWSEATLRLAPQPVRDVASRTGGVRAGQYLFTHPIGGSVMAYGLWWPWEEGSTISMRVGVDGAGDMAFRLCEAMGVEP
ncbi:MAG: hypothetical protein ACXVEF_27345 [Polyangiales bacterium]